MPAATADRTRVSQHLGVWDVRSGRGSIALFADGRRLGRIEVAELDDFAALVTMLRNPRGAWYDARTQVLSGPHEPHGGGGGGG